MSAAPATGTLSVVAPVATPVPPQVPLLAMRGSADAAACEGDACLVPGALATAPGAGSADPEDADPAADLARVRDAIDSGRAI
ncbi:hypothetical protein BFL36_03120 [Clavibacter michiganensis]|uniref:Uncharacterized protein n=1 Tax=Clavibacter michiganensis TaxID=28447 RepID=A0A251YS27_9MICO|nr:hypothetical protein [Clavibacter michiganensis]OUE26878.1 hypothetical protein BFL36_03120 [Clavibacter michiganensis]